MDVKERIQKVKNSQDFAEAASALKDLQRSNFSSAQITKLYRTLKKFDTNPDIKIAYLTNFTVDLLPGYVSVYGAIENISCSAYIGAYNQYFQEVLIKDGPLSQFSPDLIFFAISLSLVEPEVIHSYACLSEEKKLSLLDNIVSHIQQFTDYAVQNTDATVLLANFAFPQFCQGGIADNNTQYGEMWFYYELNCRLASLVQNNPRIHIFDIAKLSGRFGSVNIFDPKFYYLAKIVWSERFTGAVGEELFRYIYALQGRTKKCLVLDLDNTLWGGILGEDGIEGVKVGTGDPISEAFLDFQYKIKSLKERGIMLAICSKNNEQDVQELFEKRTSMPLKLTDFSAVQINWDRKHINLQRIAKTLNIGEDSLVFIDDNPVECDLVRQMLPLVRTVLLPQNVENIPGVLDQLVDFEKLVVLTDDKLKTEQYSQQKQRTALQESAGDLDRYLQSLETEIWVRPATMDNLERVHQLFVKTNQFNVTTIRYAAADIQKFIKDDHYHLAIVSARDRFGDLGIIGLYLLELDKNELIINSFILSCRAMGRGMETAVMNQIKKDNIYFGNKKILARFVPTKKNIPVSSFFEQQCFTCVEEKPNGDKSYSLAPEQREQIECSWIKYVDKW